MYWYRKALSCPVKWIKQRNRSPALVNSKVKGISAYIHAYIHTYLYILFILLEDNHLQDDRSLYFSQPKDGNRFHIQKIKILYFKAVNLVISFSKAIWRRCFRGSIGRKIFQVSSHICWGYFYICLSVCPRRKLVMKTLYIKYSHWWGTFLLSGFLDTFFTNNEHCKNSRCCWYQNWVVIWW